MVVATVVEGPSDRLVIEEIVSYLFPGEHTFLRLQPIVSAPETGRGWKGVRAWCRETWQRPGSSLARLLSGETGQPIDLLVVHLDADIVDEADLQEGLA